MKKVKGLKASFCVPNFNKVEYLADCVESFLEQKYENKELIIGDDFSTDKSYQLISWYCKKYPKLIKAFVNSKNIVVANTRNKIIKKSTGDIIFIMDADDMSETGRIEATMKVFNEKPSVSVVFGDCYLVNGLGQMIGTLEARDLQVWTLKRENYIPHSTVAFRKSVPVRYRKDLRFIDDWNFYLDCIDKGLKFEYIPKVMAVHRQLMDGLTMDGGFATKEKEQAKEAVRQEFKDFDDDISWNLANKEQQRIRLKKVLKMIPKGAKVLDLGANGGYVATCLIQNDCKVKCYEIATNLVKICKAKGLDVELKDARDFKVKEEYDIILAGDILEHMPPEDVKKVLENSFDALKPGGKLLATVPYKHGFYSAERIAEHVKDYSEKDFIELFDKFEYKSEGIYAGDSAISVWLLITGKKK